MSKRRAPAGRPGRTRLAADEAVELFGALVAAMDRRQDMGAWLRKNPQALRPEFGAFLAEWVRSRKSIRHLSGRPAFGISCAQTVLRIQRECRDNGVTATLARLGTAPGALGDFNTRVAELNRLVAEEGLDEGGKPLHIARKYEELLGHPVLLIVTEEGYASLLLGATATLRTLYLHTLLAEVLDLRIRIARTGLDPAPATTAHHAALLDELGFALADLSEQSGDTEPMREAARLHQRALSMTPGPCPERAGRLNSLGACFRDLYLQAHEADALDRAITYFEESAALTTATVSRNNLAVSLLDRFQRDGQTADLDRAIGGFTAIAEQARDDDPQLPRSLTDHAAALLARFRQTSDRADLDRAVELTGRALALGPPGSVLVMCQAGHAEALSRRATLTRDRAEFDRAISVFERARSGLPPGSVITEQVAGQQAMAVTGWWLGGPSTENLREVVTAARGALAAMRRDRTRRAQVACVLLGLVPYYAASTGDVAEINRAIRELEEEAGAVTEADIDAAPVIMDVPGGLARLYIERGRHTTALDEVERGLRLAPTAADIGTRAELTARGWTERFMLSRDATDLENALIAAEPLPGRANRSLDLLTIWDRLHDLACTGHRLADGRHLAEALAELWGTRSPVAGPAAAVEYACLVSLACSRRFQHSGDPQDLERAIEVTERQLAAVPTETPGYQDLQVLLGERWRELYSVTGDPAHVARAIARLDGTREAAGPGSRVFAQACGALGTAFRARFNYAGDLADLDRAIAAYELSADHVLDRENDAAIVMNLANAVRASYDYTGEGARLDRAISLHQRVVTARPPGDPDRPGALHNLATSHYARYAAKGDPADLDRAITVSTEAAAKAAADTPTWQSVLSGLGMLHEARFQAGGDPADLDIAVSLGRRAVATVKSSASSRAASSLRLAQALQARYEHGHDAEDQAEAVALYRHLCAEGEPPAGEVPLAAAWRWTELAVRRQAWPEAAQAARAATRAFGELMRLQASRGMRTGLIRRFQEIPADAAYALTRAGDHQGAVMALETGRAVSSSEALELHSADVEWLKEHGHEELAAQFETVVQRWLAASGDGLDYELAGGEQPGSGFSDRDAVIRAARTEIDKLADTIRDVSGHTGFLRSPVFADVAAAAAAEPLVYLVGAESAGAALIVRGHQIQPLQLPRLTRAAVAEWVVGLYAAYAMGDATLNWWTRLESLGRELWDAVIGPVSKALGDGPVTLVRTGHIELLPLNAAWTPDENQPSGRRYAMDGHTLRSAPNARILAAARAQARGTVDGYRLLAVEDPQPVTAPRLTSAAAEVAGVRCRFTESTLLAGPQATPEAVLAGLKNHQVVHLACHGRADLLSPLDDSLLLAGDQPLTLRDIIRVRLDRDATVRLAVLSACETSIAGLEAPDEVVSLPSGLLEAGVAGVVAAQWRVPDLSAAILMTRFYAEWASTGTDPATALQAAQRWIRDSANKDIAEYFASRELPPETSRPLWRSLIRMDPQQRSFAHPAHWAGFVFSGA